MKKLLTVLMVFAAAPATAQTLTPLQQYLYNESGYAPPQLAAPQPVQQQATTTTTTTQYTTAYAPPVPQQQYYTYPQTVPVQNAAPEGYYEDEGSDVGPSSDQTSLRGLLTSGGF